MASKEAILMFITNRVKDNLNNVKDGFFILQIGEEKYIITNDSVKALR